MDHKDICGETVTVKVDENGKEDTLSHRKPDQRLTQELNWNRIRHDRKGGNFFFQDVPVK